MTAILRDKFENLSEVAVSPKNEPKWQSSSCLASGLGNLSIILLEVRIPFR